MSGLRFRKQQLVAGVPERIEAMCGQKLLTDFFELLRQLKMFDDRFDKSNISDGLSRQAA